MRHQLMIFVHFLTSLSQKSNHDLSEDLNQQIQVHIDHCWYRAMGKEMDQRIEANDW